MVASVESRLAGSRQRIEATGLFNVSLVDLVEAMVAATRGEIDAIGATPFLHHTTTKNVIVTPESTLSGIVDVDDLCFGDARYPAALTLAALTNGVRRPRKLRLRLDAACTTRRDQIFRLYVSLFLTDLMSEHGQVFNGNQPPSTAQAHAALHRAFESNLDFAAIALRRGKIQEFRTADPIQELNRLDDSEFRCGCKDRIPIPR
jgi:hypothetical protein